MGRACYIAGQYKRKPYFRKVADMLRERGHRITSTWLDETYAPGITLAEVSDEQLRTLARADLEDIDRSDLMLFFSESELTPRGGRMVELGYALANSSMEILIVGPKENIFMFIPEVQVFERIEDALEIL